MAGNAKSHFYISFAVSKGVSQQRCFLHSQQSLCSAGLSFALCSFGCSFFCRSFGFTEFNSLNKQTTTATATATRTVVMYA